MKRLVAGILVLGTLAGCSTVEKLNPFSPSPKSKASPLVALPAGAEVKQLWRHGVGAAGNYSFTPAVSGQVVFAAAMDGSVARIENGAAIWRISLGERLSGGIGGDAERVAVGTPKGDVIVMDAKSGKELWRTRISSEVLAAPVVSEGLVVVRSGDSRLYAFDSVEGKRRWVYQRSSPALTLRSTAGVTVRGGKTFAGFPGGKLVALSNSNGAALWEGTVALPRGATELERVTDITSEPVISGGIVCAVAFQGKLTCFDLATGNGVWSRDISSSVGLDADAKGVYVTDDAGVVQSLALTSGATLWKQDKLSERGVTRPLALGQHLVVADAQGYVHVLGTDDGSLIARAQTDSSGIRSALVKTGTGFLAQSADGNVYQFFGEE